MALPASVLDAGLWGLDDLEDPEMQKVLRQAQQQPNAYVLKPQREGGGNNLYGQQLLEKLQAGKGLGAYILMQRIRPPIQPYATLLYDPHPYGASSTENSFPDVKETFQNFVLGVMHTCLSHCSSESACAELESGVTNEIWWNACPTCHCTRGTAWVQLVLI